MEKAETESKLETLRRTIGEGFNKALETIPKLIPQVKDAFITMETQMSDPQTIDRLANDAAQQVNIWCVKCTAYCIQGNIGSVLFSPLSPLLSAGYVETGRM